MFNALRLLIVVVLSTFSVIASSAQYRFEILESKYLDYDSDWIQGSFVYDTASQSFSNVNLQFMSDPLFEPDTFPFDISINQLQTTSTDPVKGEYQYQQGAIGGSGKYFDFDNSFGVVLPAMNTLVPNTNANLIWSADISRIIYSGFTCNLVDGSCEPPFGPNGEVLESKQFSISNQVMIASVTAVLEPNTSALLIAGFGLIVFIEKVISKRKNDS